MTHKRCAHTPPTEFCTTEGRKMGVITQGTFAKQARGGGAGAEARVKHQQPGGSLLWLQLMLSFRFFSGISNQFVLQMLLQRPIIG